MRPYHGGGVRPGVIVPIQTFAPEPYALLKPLHVTVRPDADEFVAHFHDANLAAYGDTEAEAVGNLKTLIALTLDNFTVPGRRLGPGPAKQLAVLNEFVVRKG